MCVSVWSLAWVTMEWYFTGLIYACNAALATHLFGLNWKFKTAIRLENYVTPSRGAELRRPCSDLCDPSGSEWEGRTYVLHHGRVVGHTAAAVDGHQRCGYISCLALRCIEFPDVCCLRGIRIDFACNFNGLMAARTVRGALSGTANGRNWNGVESWSWSRSWSSFSTCLCKLATAFA